MKRRQFLTLAAAPMVQGQGVRPPSIVLISGWNLYNIGDVAITPGFLRLVQNHFAEAEVTVLLASYPKELGQYLKERFPRVRTMGNEFKAGQKLSAEMERVFRGADLLVLNSGMTLSYGYYGLEWERYIGRLLAFLKANEMGVPFGIYGHSFDRVDPPGDILYRDVLNRAAFLYTRDSESLQVLRGIGVQAAEMGFTPDSTFAFDLKDEAATKEFLRAHHVEAGRFTAMIPRLDVNRFRNDGKEKEHAAQTRAILEAYVETAQEPVVLVHEVTRMIEPVKTMVLDQLSERARKFVRYKPDYWMPDAAAGVYARARMVVSMEMHSVILGLAAGTPALHPYFRQAGLKQWMMRDIGLEEWLIDQDEVTAKQIAGAMVQVWRDEQGSRAKVTAAMERVRRRQRETMGVVRRTALAHYSRKEMA